MKWLNKIENAFTWTFFSLGIVVSLYSVFMRYVMHSSQSWATEIYTMLLVWAIFIGFSTALRDDKHIAIDMIYDKAGPLYKKVANVITLLVGLAFSGFIVYAGVEMVVAAYSQEIKTIDIGFPIWINYLIMPLTGTLLFIRFIEKAHRFFVRKEDSVSEVDHHWQQ